MKGKVLYMKKGNLPSMLVGVVIGATVYGGGTAIASGILANPSTSAVYVDGQQISAAAYNINNHNYFKLRDIAAAVDFGVTYDGATDSIYINTSVGYTPDTPAVTSTPAPVTSSPIADGSGAVYDTPITSKELTGISRSREDFSQQANTEIFDSVYTREAYNAVRQTIVDRDKILTGNNSNGFNLNYAYAYTTATEETKKAMSRPLARMSLTYSYIETFEPYVQMYELGVAKYPGYFVVKVVDNSKADVDSAILGFLDSLKIMSTDKEKIMAINNYICDRMEFDATASASLSEVFTSDKKVKGQCASFSMAFRYLCGKADIPCIGVASSDHAWNLVYADGKWGHVDVSLNAQSSTRATMLLTETARKTDENPKATQFAQELLVPGSTK